MLQNRNQLVNNQLTRSLQNVNYSQWERKKSKPKQVEMVENPPMVFKLPQVSGNFGLLGNETKPSEQPQVSFVVSRPSEKKSFKTKRQLKDEEEQKSLMRLKLRYIREEIARLKIRESELLEINESLLDYISKTEKKSNESVDSILRRYENYQSLKKTVQEKHQEELEQVKKELDDLRQQLASELPKYEQSSNEIENKLKDAQELNRVLSVYKNQEYPEKLLQINKLRKELADLNNLHNEEHQNLQDMINYEKDVMKKNRYETTKKITVDISKKALNEMHGSLKDMASFNSSLKEQIEFYKTHLENLKLQSSQLDAEVKRLKEDKLRNLRDAVFKEILLKPKPICTPDMDVIIDYSNED